MPGQPGLVEGIDRGPGLALYAREEDGMEISDELRQSAERFGAALNELPAVQAYLEADAAVKNDPEVQQLKAEADRTYRELIERQRASGTFDPRYVSEFYRLREDLANHPLMLRREACLRAVRPLFEQAASSMSSVLSVDYTDFLS